MYRGKVLAARRAAVALMFVLSLCTAGQTASPQRASAQAACTGAPNLAATYNNVGITSSSTLTAGHFDGGGDNAAISQSGLTAAGAAPGALIVSAGVTFTFPNVAAGTPDNTVLAPPSVGGQTICMSGTGTLGFLLVSTGGGSNASGSSLGTITYDDDSTQSYSITGISDWFNYIPVPPSGALAIRALGQNRTTGPISSQVGIFSMTVPLIPGKNLKSVTLPTGAAALVNNVQNIHIFAMATTNTTLISQNKPATASSLQPTEVGGNIPDTRWQASNAVDGDLSTRWSSDYYDDEWLQVDLGYVANIDGVVLYWEEAYGRDFDIQTSMGPNGPWTTLVSITGYTPTFTPNIGSEGQVLGQMSVESLNLPPGSSGRYVRMQGVTRGTGYGYSLWEFQVYGTSPAQAASPSVTVGYNHACAIVSRTPYCWGNNDAGELGTGSASPSLLSTATEATAFSATQTPSQITAGQKDTCALNTSYQAYCWGNNTSGQLGSDSNIPTAKYAPTAVTGSGNYGHVSASYNGNHTCAVNTQNLGYCWGLNSSGQLGNSTAPSTYTYTPVPVTVMTVTTAYPAASPYTPAFTMISAGTSHTCAVAMTGYAYCWGSNAAGQLGCNTSINPAPPNGTCTSTTTSTPVAVDTSGALSGKTVTQISAGDTHTCALDSEGNAYCWGSNAQGKLGCAASDPNCGASSNVPVAVTTSGMPAGTKWAQITAGSTFTCAITTAGKAYCWGLGMTGQLGAGSATTTSPVPVAVSLCPVSGCVAGSGNTQLPDNAFLTQIDSGLNTTCAMDTESNVYCWGLGYNGELGNGTENYSFVPVRVVGALAGVLTITVPNQAVLNAGTPGGAASGQLGEVTVIDDRATGTGTWTASVSATDFTGTTPPFVIPATGVTYTITPVSPATSTFTNVVGMMPTNEAQPPGVTLGGANPEPVVSGLNTIDATWNPTITVAVPYGAAVGTFTGTIYHSVY